MQSIDEIEELVKIISKLPGLGPKSARRIILKLINNKEKIHKPLINSLADVFKNIQRCNECGALSSSKSHCSNCKIEKKKLIKYVLWRQFLINGLLRLLMFLMVISIF